MQQKNSAFLRSEKHEMFRTRYLIKRASVVIEWATTPRCSFGRSTVKGLGAPTFKLACLKDKVGFTRRAQRRGVFSRGNTRFMFPLRSLFETIFCFSKTCRTKVRRSQAHHRGVSAPSFRDGAICF